MTGKQEYREKIKNIGWRDTLKSSDTEEPIDIYFYRRIGYHLSCFCAKHGIIPNTITIISIFIGSAAGILFYPQMLWINVIGMLLLIIANILDSTDGQLARMTNNKSQLGRILDGFAGDLWFAIIYILLALRLYNSEWSAWIWLIASLAGISHILHASMADYYRNVHLFFIKGKGGSELDNSRQLKEKYKKMSFKTQFFDKFFLWFYMDYTKRQELFTPNLQKLLKSVYKKYSDTLPQKLCEEFRKCNKPLMKYTNILQFNTRVIFLFFTLFIDQVWLYFFFDLTILNGIMIYMIIRQEKISKYFYNQLAGKTENEYEELKTESIKG